MDHNLFTAFRPRQRPHFDTILQYFGSNLSQQHSKLIAMSSHCHDEHDHSGHDHGDGAHDHTDDITPALQYSLYQHINFDDITTMNEAEPDSGKAIVKKTWAERLEEKPELESDADEQLLMHIPCVYPSLSFHTYAYYSHVQVHRPSKTSLNPRPHLELILCTPNPQSFHQPGRPRLLHRI